MKWVGAIVRGIVLGLTISTLVSSCGSSPVLKFKPEHPVMEEEVKHYVKIVEKLSGGCLGKLRYAGFFKTKQDDNLLGRCTFIVPFFEPEIELVRSKWHKLNYEQKVVLGAHELYHCEVSWFQGIGHKEGLDDWGCNVSLMAPNADSKWCTNRKFKDYVKEMRWCL